MVWIRARLPAIAVAVLAGALTLPIPAQAQFFSNWGFGDGWGDQPHRPPPPSRGFSFPFFGRQFSPYGRPAGPPPDSSRAPPPRKLEAAPTTTVAVVGDSMADWLAYGLEEIYADQPQIGIVRDVRLYSGLVRYEPRNETLQWSQAIKDTLAAQKPAAIVVMLGLSDRLPLRAPPPAQTAPSPQKGKDGKSTSQTQSGAAQKPSAQAAAAVRPGRPASGESYDFRTDEWAKLYAKRIDDMIAALKSMNVPVLWVGLPAIRGTRSTADMSYLDELYHEAADRAGITYVDIWDGFVDEDGRYSVEGPDFEGQTRRLRTADGVHFTKYGALKLAHLVDQDLSRVLANPAVSMAARSQASVPAKPGAIRSAIGPVLPLAAPGGGGDDHLNGVDSVTLLGGNQPAPIASADPTISSALVRGDPLNAPAGRADDFAWPPSAATASAPPATKP
ncbi:MAG: SGNH/GDSL hydrolase family protein [Xanthobacteraceae bacterium]